MHEMLLSRSILLWSGYLCPRDCLGSTFKCPNPTMQYQQNANHPSPATRYRRPPTPHRTKQFAKNSSTTISTTAQETSHTLSTGHTPGSDPWRQLSYVNSLFTRIQELSDGVDGLTQRLNAVERTLSGSSFGADVLAPMAVGQGNGADTIIPTKVDGPSNELLQPARTVRKQPSASRLQRVGSKLQRVMSRNRQRPQTPPNEPAELDGVEIGRRNVGNERSHKLDKSQRRATLFAKGSRYQ